MHIITTQLLVTLVVLVLLAGVAALLRLLGRDKQKTGAAAYEALPALLTLAERSFFGVLQQAVASNYQVFAKVRLADILRPVRNPSRSGWQSAFNRISGKHVDFVLCDPAQLHVIAVIELDDRTHERSDRGVRDILVDWALADAHIPVLRVPARQSYSPAELRERIEGLFCSNEKTNTVQEPS